MKASVKMQKAIAKVEKTYGFNENSTVIERNYGVETIKDNQVGRGFYDYCELKWSGRVRATVAHDGTISIY